jgi:hypothetical protein
MNKEIEQDFKELNISLDYICQQRTKDAGHSWIEFSDKFKAFEKKIKGIYLERVVYVPTPIEGEEIPPWGDSNLYLLYDNGEIVNHLEDEQPFAICTHWLKKTTIRELIHQPYK